MDLARAAHRFAAGLPGAHRGEPGLSLQRTASAIPASIAEGYARQSRQDYLHHVRAARGSLAELSTRIELVVSLNLGKRDMELERLMAEQERVLTELITNLELENGEARRRRRLTPACSDRLTVA
ncbi:MAG: four helix bundle protein [Planctomycetota bacterium]